MLWLLLKLRLKVLINTVRARTLTSPALSVSATETVRLLLTSIFLLSFMIISFSLGMVLFPFVHKMTGAAGVESIVNAFFIAAFIATLLSSLSIAFYSLFSSADLPIWIIAPIPMRVIFAEKFIEVLLGSSGFYVVLFFPAFIALGIALKAGIVFYLALLPVSLLFMSIPAGIGMMLIMFIVRFVKIKRLKEIIGAIGGLLGLAVYTVTQLLPVQTQKHGLHVARAWELLDKAQIEFLPTDWIARVLVASGLSKYSDALPHAIALFVVGLGVFLLVLITTETMYYTGLSNVAEMGGKKKRSKVKRVARYMKLSNPIGAIVVKDAKCLLRDPQEWIQLLWPLVIMFIFMFRTSSDHSGPNLYAGGAEAIFSVFFLMFIMSIFAVRLSLTGIGREKKSIWIIHLSPVKRSNIVLAKLLAAFIPSLIMSELVYIATALIQEFPLSTLAIGMMTLAGSLVGINALGIMLGSMYPKFDAKNPKELIQRQGGLLYMLLSMLYIGGLAIAVAIPQLGRLAGIAPAILWILSMVTLYTVSGISTALFLRIASNKLEAIEITV